jgi:SAM-dependent methyltransferase
MQSETTADKADELRSHLRGMWSTVADAWAEHADYVDGRGAGVTERMLDLADLRPGQRVLELACGPGSVGLEAARRVGPTGHVMMSDVVAEMTAIAAGRASLAGLTNVSTRELDLEQIEQPDNSFDVVLCREGLMFAPDPGRAVREIQRVMRPGGRVALAVWGPRDLNPWLSLVFEAMSAQLGMPIPPPGVPGPFSLDDPEKLLQLVGDAGLGDAVVAEFPTPLHAASFEQWWTRTSALAGPLATMLSSLPAEAAQALEARLRQAVRPYETPTGLEFPGVTLLASARR